jgi:phage terminase large subunit GpA-like protein
MSYSVHSSIKKRDIVVLPHLSNTISTLKFFVTIQHSGYPPKQYVRSISFVTTTFGDPVNRNSTQRMQQAATLKKIKILCYVYKSMVLSVSKLASMIEVTNKTKKTKLRGLSPRENYTEW